MLNYIWSFMMITAVIFGALSGRLDLLASEALAAAKDAIMTTLSLTGAMCMWSGLLKIAEEGGIINALKRLLRPVLRLLFPKINPNSDAAGAIISNMSANLLGMGNAATPFGIKAMRELDRLNPHSGVASDAMCMFVVVNTASIQLIPTTMIAILSGAGAKNPFDIIIPTLISSFFALILGALMCSALSHKSFRGRKINSRKGLDSL